MYFSEKNYNNSQTPTFNSDVHHGADLGTADVPPQHSSQTEGQEEEEEADLDVPPQHSSQTEGQEEEEADLDLPAIRETIQFAKTGRLNSPPKKIPKFSANRVRHFNRKIYRPRCNHVKDCKNCQDWCKGVENHHANSYHRQYRIIRRTEDSASAMTNYTRDLKKQVEQLQAKNEQLQRQIEQLQAK